MKQYITDMLSGSNEVSSKRLQSFICLFIAILGFAALFVAPEASRKYIVEGIALFIGAAVMLQGVSAWKNR